LSASNTNFLVKKGSKRNILFLFFNTGISKMMKLCLLFGFCLAVALAAEETALSKTCSPQLLNTHQQCEENAIKEGLEMKKTIMKDAFECFQKNKCEFCEEEGEGSGHHGSGHHEPTAEEKAEEECLKELFESEHKNLSACVAKETNGLDLPFFPKHHMKGHREERGHHSGHHSGHHHSGHHEHHSGHHSGHGSGKWEEKRKHQMERFAHRVYEACKGNNESTQAVFECLKEIKPVAEQDKEKFCAARKTCESEIEGKCDREDAKFAEEEVRKALKTCVTKTAIQDLIKEAKACGGQDHQHIEAKHHEKKNKGEGHHGSGHHHSGSGHHPHFPHHSGDEHHSGHHSGHHGEHREHEEHGEHGEHGKHRDFCKKEETVAPATSG